MSSTSRISGVRADPVERVAELALLHAPLFVAHHALAQTEPAVERALVVDAEGDPVAVDAHHVLDRRVRHLVERIGEAGRIVELGHARHHLAADRTLGIARVHQRGVIGRDHEAEALGAAPRSPAPRRGWARSSARAPPPSGCGSASARSSRASWASGMPCGALTRDRAGAGRRRARRRPARPTGRPSSSARMPKEPSGAKVGSGLISRKTRAAGLRRAGSPRARSRGNRAPRRRAARARRARARAPASSDPGTQWRQPPAGAGWRSSACRPIRVVGLERALEHRQRARRIVADHGDGVLRAREEALDQRGLLVVAHDPLDLGDQRGAALDPRARRDALRGPLPARLHEERKGAPAAPPRAPPPPSAITICGATGTPAAATSVRAQCLSSATESVVASEPSVGIPDIASSTGAQASRSRPPQPSAIVSAASSSGSSPLRQPGQQVVRRPEPHAAMPEARDRRFEQQRRSPRARTRRPRPRDRAGDADRCRAGRTRVRSRRAWRAGGYLAARRKRPARPERGGAMLRAPCWSDARRP